MLPHTNRGHGLNRRRPGAILWVPAVCSVLATFLVLFPGRLTGKFLGRSLQDSETLLDLLTGTLLRDTTGEEEGKRFPEERKEEDLPGPMNKERRSSKAWGSMDTSGGRPDSLRIAQDTTYVVFLDSTARLAHFNPVRRDHPQVPLFAVRTHPLFARIRAPGYRREVKLDSSGSTMTVRELVAGNDVRIPLSLSLPDYIRERRRRELRSMLADEVRKPPTMARRDDLGELLTSITNIQIPIPQNPILSVFGGGGINLSISGAVDIKAGFRNTTSDQTQLSRLDQSRNEPDFSQEVAVNVSGTIGDKLNILADWNTQRTFEYENQLRLKYTGYDDEIVQSVEAGNVALATPSSFIGSSQALFGVKALFQAGPLKLTTLASQKKGQIKEVSVSGGAQEVPFEIRAWNYSTNNYFVDTSYIRHYEPYYQNDPPTVNGNIQIVEEEVWVLRQGGIPDPNDRQAIAYVDLPPYPGNPGYDDSLRGRTEQVGRWEVGRFLRLQRNQYELTGDGYIGVLSLNTNVQDNQIVAIAYRRADGTQFGELSRNYGVDDTSRTIVLKMVKPKNLLSNGPGYPVPWLQLLKNIYSVGGRNLKEVGFALDINRESAGAERQNAILGQPLLRVLGLDRFNANGTPAPTGDGQFDFRPRITVSLTRAEVIFPTLRPFNDAIINYFRDNGLPFDPTNEENQALLYPEIYDTTRTFASQNSLKDKYVIAGKATGEATSKYSLGFNIVEGSVQVLLDGRSLVNNVDFTVDYITGDVVIRNDRALVPGANLQIKYEQNDLFQLASKTLLGARGDLSLGPTANFGFTLMNLNQQSLSDKVRLGEEPNNNTILGMDGALNFDLPFLTRAIDAVPLLQTREPSALKVTGEAAYMLPDPNTRKSPIPSDGGEGVAYIDDFEGSRRSIPVGIGYGQWTLASAPADPASQTIFGSADTAKAQSRGKMVWFNRLPTDVALTTVYPQKRPGKGANDQITVLDFRYFPNVRGPFNYSADLGTTLTPSRNWGGVMKPISVSATNLVTENINFIELWMQVSRLPALQPEYAMVIEMGAISEDVIPNRALNDEDYVVSSNPNGTLQEGEDVGLDMLTNEQERARYGNIPGIDGNDPSGDDYAFSNSTVGTPQEDYSRINGTENNKNSPSGLIPDTEDLNGNGIVDQANSYFRYVLPLNTDTTVIPNPFIVGGGNQGWYQFRIPIRDFVERVGSPSLENIEFIRVLFVNAADTVMVRIADFSLVGNQWRELRKDSTFAVSVISVEDNPSYTSPPGVIRERDKTRPDEEVFANEQSLALLLNGVPDGESREAVKYYTFRPLDVFNYKTMKMFVHGDPSFGYRGPGDYDAEFFYRFGVDSLNFYEYRAPVHPGWDPRNEVIIDFAELTAIKADRDSVTRISDPKPVRDGPPGAVYRVLGNPSLIAVRFLSVGVTNRVGRIRGDELSGQVWVNELRLISVDDTPGWAYRFDTQLKLADLGTVAFNYSRVDPTFHTLEQRFGSRQTGTNWGLNASVQLDRLFPVEWAGTSLPFSYSHNEAIIRPKYLPNSDVVVTEAAERARARILAGGGSAEAADAESGRIRSQSESFRITDTYAAPTLRLGLPFSEWFIRDTFNKLTFGFNYTRSTDRSPTVERSLSWQWSARIAWALNFSPEYHIAPFKDLFDGVWLLDEFKAWKLFFAPTNFSWSFTTTRMRSVSLQRAPGSIEIINRNFTASRQLGFGWKVSEGGLINPTADYSLQVESSLLGMETDPSGRQRSFSRILNDIFMGDKLVNFGEDTRYGQRVALTTRPAVPNIFSIKKYIDITFGYSVDYSWSNQLQRGDLGKSTGFTNAVTASANLRLKQLIDPWFQPGPPEPVGVVTPPRGRRGATEGGSDTTAAQPPDTTTGGKGGMGKTFDQLLTIFKLLVKTPLLDYDNINVTFTQSNGAQNSGIPGRTGFVNFWGRAPFFQEADDRFGPSRLYQLGLISDPTGRLVNFGLRESFPFFGWDVEPGLRAPGGVLVNSYRQSNKIALKTSRGLWEGARIDLTWSIGWSYNRTQNITSDSLTGVQNITNTSISGNVERTFFTLPDVLFFGMFKSNLKQVSKRYAELKAGQDSTVAEEERLAVAFEEGFEAFPWLRRVFGQYYPRVNWNFRWDGLERLPLFSGFVSRLSLDHAYGATYTRQYRLLPGTSNETTEGQRVAYGFTPLIGLNFTFKDLLSGSMGATMRYNSSTAYDLQTSSRNIVETLTQEISVTASYTRRGFEIPLFGLTLNNDLDVSFSYAISKNSRRSYEVARLDVNADGTPLEGTTRTVLEPRIKYILSARVTASIYYRFTKVAPDDSGSRIPGTTTNEAGLDLRISIQ